jgi:hypothetical protein
MEQGKSSEQTAVFVHGKSSGRGSDTKEDKYEKKLFSDDRPPRFNKVPVTGSVSDPHWLCADPDSGKI